MQREANIRAQKAEEERARTAAAMQALQQHNLQLQQQQVEAQRLAELDRQGQQQLREKHHMQAAQSRQAISC